MAASHQLELDPGGHLGLGGSSITPPAPTWSVEVATAQAFVLKTVGEPTSSLPPEPDFLTFTVTFFFSEGILMTSLPPPPSRHRVSFFLCFCSELLCGITLTCLPFPLICASW